MSLTEFPRFTASMLSERLHPVDAAKRAEQPDWDKLELVGDNQIKLEMDQRITGVLGQDGVKVQLAEIRPDWPFSQISDTAKARPDDIRKAIFESMLFFVFDPSKKKHETRLIDREDGCRREIDTYESSQVPGLSVSFTQLVSNQLPDKNLVVVSSWSAGFKKPPNGLVQGLRKLFTRLDDIIPAPYPYK